jgi:hypothetical protein
LLAKPQVESSENWLADGWGKHSADSTAAMLAVSSVDSTVSPLAVALADGWV